MDNQITYPYIESFLEGLQPPAHEYLRELETFSRRENVPSAVRPTARLLYLLASLKKPERILEIGTAVGYSALTMYLGTEKKAKIVTIEKDEERFLLARNHFRSFGALGDIKPLCGDAEELLSAVEGPFDMVFIDAAKSASRQFFDLALKKAAPDAMLITDNVLYGGRTAQEGEPEHKHRTGVKAMQGYLDYLCTDPRFYTAVLPVGDGVAVTLVKNFQEA